jgi:hypothetical protein
MTANSVTTKPTTRVEVIGSVHVLTIFDAPFAVCCIATMTRFAPDTKSMAPHGGYAGLAASFGESIPEPIAIITTVGKTRFGGWQGIKDQPRTIVIAHLPLAEQQDEGLALAVADSVELRVQAAFRAPNAAGNSPFFNRLAAVRCAFRWVASIIMRSGFGPSPASAAKIRSNTPNRLQRMKRL